MKPKFPGGLYVSIGLAVGAFFFTGLVVVLRKHKMQVDGEYTGPSIAPGKPKKDALPRLEELGLYAN